MCELVRDFGDMINQLKIKELQASRCRQMFAMA